MGVKITTLTIIFVICYTPFPGASLRLDRLPFAFGNEQFNFDIITQLLEITRLDWEEIFFGQSEIGGDENFIRRVE